MSRKASESSNTGIAEETTVEAPAVENTVENEAGKTDEKVAETVSEPVEETKKKTATSTATTKKKEPRIGIYQYLLRYKVENEQIGNLMRIVYKKEAHTPTEWRAMYEALCKRKIATASYGFANV